MIYVALLRGINVGGNRKVDMKRLRSTFEEAGMTSVRTYINSGNVIFATRFRNTASLTRTFEELVHQRFGFEVSVLLLDLERMRAIVHAIPARWTDDATMRCYVMFLWPAADRRGVLEELGIRRGIDDVRYAPGAVIWKVSRKNVNRSGMARMVGTPIYRQMTIRNCNTARTLLALMEEPATRGA